MMEVFHLVHDVQKLIHSGHLHHTLSYCSTYIPLEIKSHTIYNRDTIYNNKLEADIYNIIQCFHLVIYIQNRITSPHIFS